MGQNKSFATSEYTLCYFFVCFLAGYRFDFIVLILVIVIFMKIELVFFLLLLIQFK